MASKKDKLSISNTILVTLCATFSILWSGLVIYFLFNGGMIVSSTHVIGMCVFTVCSICGVYGLFNMMLSHIKSNTLKYFLTLLLFTVIYLMLVFNSPYSPTHDSLDLELILREMQLGKFSGTYFSSYMNFFATNKLAIYLYYPFVHILHDTETGIRIANALFMWISSVCISVIAYRIKGINAASVSLISMIFLFPALLFSGPYIYPPAIMLSAISIAFYMHKEPFIRVFGYLFAGILFTMRPLSLGVLLVYVVCWSFFERGTKKRKIVYALFKTLLIIFVCFIVQWYIGKVMFLTGTHNFEKLESSMTLWTLDVGTRDEGELTGFCRHTPAIMTDEEVSDEILGDFHQLWRYYASPQQYSHEISEVKKNIVGNLLNRIQHQILSDKESIQLFLQRKFSNYYRDYYKPYFYTVNINSPDAAELLYKNYDYKYFLYENVLLILFYFTAATGALSTCIKVYRQKRNSYEAVKAFILFFGVICTSIISILFTEVGKRLIFDSFVPMFVVISINILRLCKVFKHNKKKKKTKTPLTVILSISASAAGVLGTYYINSANNIEIFKNCDIVINETRDVTIKFEKPIEGNGYVFSNHYDEKTDMNGLSEVNARYIFEEYVARPVYFGFTLPSGKHIYVSYFE